MEHARATGHAPSYIIKFSNFNNKVTYRYEPRDINHTIYFNKDVNKILLKLSKDISIHTTLKKNEV